MLSTTLDATVLLCLFDNAGLHTNQSFVQKFSILEQKYGHIFELNIPFFSLPLPGGCRDNATCEQIPTNFTLKEPNICSEGKAVTTESGL